MINEPTRTNINPLGDDGNRKTIDGLVNEIIFKLT